MKYFYVIIVQLFIIIIDKKEASSSPSPLFYSFSRNKLTNSLPESSSLTLQSYKTHTNSNNNILSQLLKETSKNSQNNNELNDFIQKLASPLWSLKKSNDNSNEKCHISMLQSNFQHKLRKLKSIKLKNDNKYCRLAMNNYGSLYTVENFELDCKINFIFKFKKSILN
jgi:hypothetical protein